MNLGKLFVTRQAEVQPGFLSVQADSTKLAEGDRIFFVKEVVLALLEIPGTFQLSGCAGNKPDDQLELLITGQQTILSLDFEQFFDQLEDITQFISIAVIQEMRIQHGVSNADKGRTLRCIESAENGGRQRGVATCDSASSQETQDERSLFRSQIFEEQPIDEKRFEELAIRGRIRSGRERWIFPGRSNRQIRVGCSKDFFLPQGSGVLGFALGLPGSGSGEVAKRRIER